MNHTLSALMKKLTWQRNELEAHLQAAEHGSLTIEQQLDTLKQKLNQSSSTPLLINPELEVNRLNFIAHTHQQQEQLLMKLKEQHLLVAKLKDKLIRTNCELKMLEKYAAREQSKQTAQDKKMQEQTLEEWVIQKRERI